MFCSTVAACEDLPARVRTRLEKLRAAHSYEQLSSSFQRFAGGTAKTLTGARKEAHYHLVEDGALYLAPHAISHVVDDDDKRLPQLSEGDKTDKRSVTPEQHFTQPPPHDPTPCLVAQATRIAHTPNTGSQRPR